MSESLSKDKMALQDEIRRQIAQYQQRLVEEHPRARNEAEALSADSDSDWRHIYATLETASGRSKTSPSTGLKWLSWRRRAQALIYRSTSWYVEHRMDEQRESFDLLTGVIRAMAHDLSSLHTQVRILQSRLERMESSQAEISRSPASSGEMTHASEDRE
jgi:hypothetical protein